MTGILNKAKEKWLGTGILLQIIIINIVIFFPLHYSSEFGWGLNKYFSLSLDWHAAIRKPWTFISCLFSHEDFGHVFFNMIWFWMMGRIFQEVSGLYHWSKITFLYLFGGFVGLVFLFVFALALPQFFQYDYVLGASDGVMAIALAVGFLAPDYEVAFFLVGNIKIKWVVVFLFVTATAIDLTMNIGGKISHLGGAVFGMIYGLNLKKGKDISIWFTNLLSFKRKKTVLKVVHNRKTRTDEEYNEHRHQEARTLDELLDKINKSGYDSLSRKEKETLHQLSKK